MGPGLLVSESQFRKEKKKKMVTGSEFIRPKVEWAIREDTSLGLLISESPLEKGREKKMRLLVQNLLNLELSGLFERIPLYKNILYLKSCFLKINQDITTDPLWAVQQASHLIHLNSNGCKLRRKDESQLIRSPHLYHLIINK